MDITRAGSQPSGRGPADWFTGSVRIDSPLPTTGTRARRRSHRDIRTRRTDRVAHTPTRPDADRHGRLRTRAARRPTGRGDPARRRGLVCARREALARRVANHRDDAHRHPASSSFRTRLHKIVAQSANAYICDKCSGIAARSLLEVFPARGPCSFRPEPSAAGTNLGAVPVSVPCRVTRLSLSGLSCRSCCRSRRRCRHVTCRISLDHSSTTTHPPHPSLLRRPH